MMEMYHMAVLCTLLANILWWRWRAQRVQHSVKNITKLSCSIRISKQNTQWYIPSRLKQILAVKVRDYCHVVTCCLQGCTSPCGASARVLQTEILLSGEYKAPTSLLSSEDWRLFLTSGMYQISPSVQSDWEKYQSVGQSMFDIIVKLWTSLEVEGQCNRIKSVFEVSHSILWNIKLLTII